MRMAVVDLWQIVQVSVVVMQQLIIVECATMILLMIVSLIVLDVGVEMPI